MQSHNEPPALPLGLGMALAQNPAAMQRFAAMPPTQQQAVIQQAHAVSSRREMQALVASLVRSGTQG